MESCAETKTETDGRAIRESRTDRGRHKQRTLWFSSVLHREGPEAEESCRLKPADTLVSVAGWKIRVPDTVSPYQRSLLPLAPPWSLGSNPWAKARAGLPARNDCSDTERANFWKLPRCPLAQPVSCLRTQNG